MAAPGTDNLTLKQKALADAIIAGAPTQREAAKMAGMHEQTASKLLKQDKVADYILAAKAEQGKNARAVAKKSIVGIGNRVDRLSSEEDDVKAIAGYELATRAAAKYDESFGDDSEQLQPHEQRMTSLAISCKAAARAVRFVMLYPHRAAALLQRIETMQATASAAAAAAYLRDK